jgi:hypothetical protein
MTNRIDDFRAKLLGGGARPNQFRVQLTFPTWVGGNIAADAGQFLVRSASLPRSNIIPIDVPFRGRVAKIAGDRMFDNWQIDVLNDNDFVIRNALERWSAGILNHTNAGGRLAPTSYTTNMIVQQLDRNDMVVKEYKFYNCFPQVVGDIRLDAANMQAIEEYNVEFSVDYYESLVNGSTITP